MRQATFYILNQPNELGSTIPAHFACACQIIADYYRQGARVFVFTDDRSQSHQVDELLWSFDADGELLRLVTEANRIKLAHHFDPYLAIHTSLVQPLPHQITAVYGEMLPRHPLRFLLADDPGADHLDALLCAVQAGWAWTQRDNNFGVSGQIDPLEGWIADPILFER